MLQPARPTFDSHNVPRSAAIAIAPEFITIPSGSPKIFPSATTYAEAILIGNLEH